MSACVRIMFHDVRYNGSGAGSQATIARRHYMPQARDGRECSGSRDYEGRGKKVALALRP